MISALQPQAWAFVLHLFLQHHPECAIRQPIPMPVVIYQNLSSARPLVGHRPTLGRYFKGQEFIAIDKNMAGTRIEFSLICHEDTHRLQDFCGLPMSEPEAYTMQYECEEITNSKGN